MQKYWWIGLVEFLLILGCVAFLYRQRTTRITRPIVYKQTYALESRNPPKTVLGVQTDLVMTATPLIWKRALDPISPTVLPTSKPLKQSYSIVLFGDSMIQTWGKDLLSLKQVFEQTYPETKFELTNMGKGSENVEVATDRISTLALPRADIALVGSYSYNPFVPHNVNRHRDNLVRLLRKLKSSYSQVYLLVEIAPTKDLFGQGPGGVNWDKESAYIQATNIMTLLELSLDVARKETIPVIDAYTPSQRFNDKSGDLIYIDTKDHIHPSIEGQRFMAELMVEQIKLDY